MDKILAAFNTNNPQRRMVTFMAMVPIVLVGLLLGVAIATHFDPIDVLPAFTLTVYIFYTAVLVVWRAVSMIEGYAFFKKLAGYMAIFEGVFLIFIYVINLVIDAKMFVYVPA